MSLRPLTPDDDSFCRALYHEVRRAEFLPLGLPPEGLEAILNHQYQARTSHYSAVFPQAENSIILVSAEPVGYMILDRGVEQMKLVDLAVLPDWRSKGIASQLLRNIVKDADEARVPVFLSVDTTSPARHLYERFGFLEVDNDGLRVTMRRPCQGS